MNAQIFADNKNNMGEVFCPKIFAFTTKNSTALTTTCSAPHWFYLPCGEHWGL